MTPNFHTNAELLARFTTDCVIPPDGKIRIQSVLTGQEEECLFQEWVSPNLFADEKDNRLDLFCRNQGALANEYALDFVSSDANQTQIGRCPWVGGVNEAQVHHTGDNFPPSGADCIFSVFWRSTEPSKWQGCLPNDNLLECIYQVDWKEYLYMPESDRLVLRHYRSLDGPGKLFPDKLIKDDVQESDQINIMNFNPDPFTEDEPTPMISVFTLTCDIDRDGDCDMEDVDIAEEFLGECKNGDNYNTLADANHDGCVTQTDLNLIMASDSDNDGTNDFEDQCLNSKMNTSIVLGECDSGVSNRVLPNGCTIVDLLEALTESVAINHGKFVSNISELTNNLKMKGVITGKEKGAIQSCAARTEVP